jgi:hypothetical protein
MVSGVAALLCGGAGLAAIELIERRQIRLGAWLALAGTLVEFALIELGIWTFVDESSNRYARWAWTATIWLVPTLVIPTYTLLVRNRRLALFGLLLLAVSSIAFAAVFTEIVWTHGDHDTAGRITAILGVLAVATYLVAPALARSLPSAAARGRGGGDRRITT